MEPTLSVTPIATRPFIPAVYGVPETTENLLPWSHVRDRMTAAKQYWIATVTPGGRPQTRPISGMWLDDCFYFGGDPQARWCRNLGESPHASIHLEDGEEAVILEGRVATIRPDAELAKRLSEQSNDKYAMGQKPEDYQGVELCEFRASVGLAWKDMRKDATRWRLEWRPWKLEEDMR